MDWVIFWSQIMASGKIDFTSKNQIVIFVMPPSVTSDVLGCNHAIPVLQLMVYKNKTEDSLIL